MAIVRQWDRRTWSSKRNYTTMRHFTHLDTIVSLVFVSNLGVSTRSEFMTAKLFP